MRKLFISLIAAFGCFLQAPELVVDGFGGEVARVATHHENAGSLLDYIGCSAVPNDHLSFKQKGRLIPLIPTEVEIKVGDSVIFKGWSEEEDRVEFSLVRRLKDCEDGFYVNKTGGDEDIRIYMPNGIIVKPLNFPAEVETDSYHSPTTILGGGLIVDRAKMLNVNLSPAFACFPPTHLTKDSCAILEEIGGPNASKMSVADLSLKLKEILAPFRVE